MESTVILDFNFEYLNPSFFYLLGETYQVSPYFSNLNCENILSDPTLIDSKYIFEGILISEEVDTLSLYFEYYENCVYLVEFYDNLFGNNDWSKISKPPRYWRIYFGILDYFMENIIFKDNKYTFWEHFWGTAGRWYPRAWGLLFYQQFLYNQFYLFSNFTDLNNLHVNYELSLYGFVWDSLMQIDTHYDLIFPYFIDSSWEIVPLHVYWLSSNEFVYSLPYNFDNSLFDTELDVKLKSNSFFGLLLWFDYDLLSLDWFFIFLYNISYLLYFFLFYFCSIYFFFFNFFIFFFLYKKNDDFLNWFFFKLLRFSYCFFIWYPKLLMISLFSLFSFLLRIMVEQNYWFYGISIYWAYYYHSMLYGIRKSFLHYYLRFGCIYFWMFFYFFFYSLYYFIISLIRIIPYNLAFLYFYLFLINLFYDVFIKVPFLFLKKMWSQYLWFVLHKYLLTHTEVTFKFISIFDRVLKVYHRYFKFKPFDAKYYRHFGFFTSYYKRGIIFSNFNNLLKLFFSYLSFFFSIFIFFFSKFWSYIIFVGLFLFENVSFLFFKFLMLIIFVKIFLLGLLCDLNVNKFSKFTYLFINLILNVFVFNLLLLKKILCFVPAFLKQWFFKILKLFLCIFNLFFFNFIFFFLHYLPIVFFFLFKFLIKYRIFFLILFFIFNLKSLIYFFVISLVIFFNHYICFHGVFYWDIICLIHNPNIKLYHYDFFVRYGEFYVTDWVNEYERFFNLYNNCYYRWWQYRWRRRWATRYMFLYCCRVRIFFKFLSAIGPDAWYILLLHWDYSLLYLFLAFIKKLLKFLLCWLFFVFYELMPRILLIIPDFIVFSVYFIYYFICFVLKAFCTFVNVSLGNIVKIIYDKKFNNIFIYFYKFFHFFFNNIYLDVLNILILKRKFIENNYLEFFHIHCKINTFIFDLNSFNSYFMKVEKWSVNYFFCKFLIFKWYVEVILYDLMNLEFLRFFWMDFFRHIFFSTVFIEFAMEIFQYFFFVYVFKNLGDSLLDLILKDIFFFLYDLYNYYSNFINIIVFFYLFKEIFQYYADVFSFNIELSRFAFIDYGFFLGKKPRFNWFRETAFPNIRRSSSFHHYSLTKLEDIFSSLKTPGKIFFTHNFKFYYLWYNYLFHNSFHLVFYAIFFGLFFFKRTKKLLFFNLGYFSNPDYLWTLFRSKNIEDVDWLFKNLNTFEKFKRSLIVSGTKYVMSIADFDDFVNFSSRKFDHIREATKKNIMDVRETLLDLDKDLAQKAWLKESRRLFNEGQVDFLEFFFSPHYKCYYDNLTKNYLSLTMLVSYGFNKSEILKRLSYYENEIEYLDHLFIKQQFAKKGVQDFIKGYFYFLDENLYNYKLPYWIFHKDFFRYQVINQKNLNDIKEFSKDNYQIVLDFESFPSSCIVWFWFFPLVFLKFMLLMKGFICFKTYWMDNSYFLRSFASHFFDFYFSFVDKLSWIFWDVLGEKRTKRSSQSAPFKSKSKRQLIYSNYYFKTYYEGAYLKWLHENTNTSWGRVWFLLQNRKFYGFFMLNSAIYSNIGFFLLLLFCLYGYRFLFFKQVYFSIEKNDLMFFSRALFIKIWRLENYLNFKNKVRSFIIKYGAFDKK